jgi:hypothetical protein
MLAVMLTEAAMATYKLLTTEQAEELTGGAITARDLQRRARLGDLPRGVVVRLGRRLYVAEDRYIAFLASGGAALQGPGGWRRPDAAEASTT